MEVTIIITPITPKEVACAKRNFECKSFQPPVYQNDEGRSQQGKAGSEPGQQL